MIVKVTSKGFVKIGILFPKPTHQACITLCGQGNYDKHRSIQRALNVSGPDWLEFHSLNKGFGYQVYKEGFDVCLHYSAVERAN